jgi:hypothetical protein
MKRLAFTLAILTLGGCQTYKYADKVKMIAFSDDLSKGQSIGNVRGEDCQSIFLGYPTGPAPKLDRAMEHLQNQTLGKDIGLSVDEKSKNNTLALRYINDVTTSWDGFDAGIMAKRCLIVKGRGYK